MVHNFYELQKNVELRNNCDWMVKWLNGYWEITLWFRFEVRDKKIET